MNMRLVLIFTMSIIYMTEKVRADDFELIDYKNDLVGRQHF